MDSQSTFFRPGGTLEPGAECYIARKADEQLLSALLRGEYVFLLDSRQKGKSSLIARSILKLREAGVRQVKLDLQRIGANVTPEQWYAGLAVGRARAGTAREGSRVLAGAAGRRAACAVCRRPPGRDSAQHNRASGDLRGRG